MHDVAIKGIENTMNDVDLVPNQCVLSFAHVDFATTPPTKPPREIIGYMLPLWCTIGGNELILNCIAYGVYFPLTCMPIKIHENLVAEMPYECIAY